MLLAGAGIAARDLLRRGPTGLRVDAMYQDDGVALAQLGRSEGASPVRRAPLPRALRPATSGAITLVSGALYNSPDLAVSLGLERSITPASLVDAVIDRWGLDGLARIDGDYALARWTPDRRSMLLAACPMGRDSLYYARTRDGILAASRASWLLAFPEVDAEPDSDALALRLAKMESRIGDRTPWRHIRRVQPGQFLEWRDSRVHIADFWSPVPRTTLRLRKSADYIEAAREHLDRAVAARCPAGVPVLCLLSAGLDSTAVAATAAQRHDAPVHTLTVRADPTVAQLQPDSAHFADEWERLQPFLAAHPELIAHVADAVQPDLDLEYAGGPLQSREWPFKRPYQISWLMAPLERALQKLGISAVLSADAGNATLSYNGAGVVADQTRAGQWLSAWGNLSSGSWAGKPRALWREGLSPLMPERVIRTIRRLRGQPDHWWQRWSALRPEVAERLGLNSDDQPRVRTGSRDLDQQIMLLDRLRNNNAHYAHVFQGQSWSWRDPLADLALVEFCLSLPRDQFRSGGVGRLLARNTLADRIPASIRNERRIGLQHADWYGWMSRRRDWMAAEIARIERSPLACSILDTRHMRAILDAWPATPEEAGRFPTSHRLRKGLGEALRVGQFILTQEGRND